MLLDNLPRVVKKLEGLEIAQFSIFSQTPFSNRLLGARKSAYDLAFANVRESGGEPDAERSDQGSAAAFRWRNRGYRTADPGLVINSVSLRCKAPCESAKSRPRVE